MSDNPKYSAVATRLLTTKRLLNAGEITTADWYAEIREVLDGYDETEQALLIDMMTNWTNMLVEAFAEDIDETPEVVIQTVAVAMAASHS